MSHLKHTEALTPCHWELQFLSLCNGWSAKRFINAVLLNALLQPQAVIQWGPKSPGVSSGNEKLLVLNYRIFCFTYEEH